MLVEAWHRPDPRDFQIEAIYTLCYARTDNGGAPSLSLVRKTGEGKSMVFQGAATIMRGVSIFIMPLIGLGSDQLSKSYNPAARVYARHLDEETIESARELSQHLIGLSRAERKSFILYASPQSFRPGTVWSHTLDHLIANRMLSLVAFDEAHAVPVYGMSFRPEFAELKTNLFKKINEANLSVPLLAASASFNAKLQDQFSRLLDRKFTHYISGTMERREINFKVTITTQVVPEMKKEVAKYLKHDSTKAIVYTNTRTSAEDHLFDHFNDLVESINTDVEEDVMTLTGGTGVMMKAFLVDLFSNKISSDTCNLRVLIATSAANCGISSDYCYLAARYGLPPSLLYVLQEMGRVARALRDADSDYPCDCYHLFTDLKLFATLLLRTYNSENKRVINAQIREHHDVLKMIVAPRTCYHLAVEEEFESSASVGNRPGCELHCPACRGEHRSFAGGPIRRTQLVDFLLATVFINGPVKLMELPKKLHDAKKNIWAVQQMKKLLVGHAQCLVLQLIASGILRVFVGGEVDGSTVKLDNLLVTWETWRLSDKDDIHVPRFRDDFSWVLINWV